MGLLLAHPDFPERMQMKIQHPTEPRYIGDSRLPGAWWLKPNPSMQLPPPQKAFEMVIKKEAPNEHQEPITWEILRDHLMITGNLWVNIPELEKTMTRSNYGVFRAVRKAFKDGRLEMEVFRKSYKVTTRNVNHYRVKI